MESSWLVPIASSVISAGIVGVIMAHYSRNLDKNIKNAEKVTELQNQQMNEKLKEVKDQNAELRAIFRDMNKEFNELNKAIAHVKSETILTHDKILFLTNHMRGIEEKLSKNFGGHV